MLLFPEKTIIQQINDPLFEEHKISLFIKREDLLHEHISGNKWHKLKYNIQEAKNKKQKTILTFGGAYSNHIAATAYAGKLYNINTIGIIRGEKHDTLNHTLKFAKDNGMQLNFISRQEYRNKKNTEYVKSLRDAFGDFYLIPEGGNNVFALKGCAEMLEQTKNDYDYYTVSCGTGATLAGMSIGLNENKKIIGFSALKGGDFFNEDIKNAIAQYNSFFGSNCKGENFKIMTEYHFGAYAKITSELLDFVKNFKIKHNVPLDYIYTGKMMFGIYDLIKNNYFKKGSKILAIHTGGLQGNEEIENQALCHTK